MIYVYRFFNAPFVVPDPKRTLGPGPCLAQRTQKGKKTDPKKSTPRDPQKMEDKLGMIVVFFVVGCTWIDVFGGCVIVYVSCFVSTENTGFYEFLCVVGSGLWMHTTSNTWEYAWRLLTRRMNNKMEPRNSLHCFLTEADQRYGSQHVLCAKNIVYIYIYP